MSDDDRAGERRLMVERQIRTRGIASEPVLRAMAAVPRHLFVPEALRSEAYADRPLAIGDGQTISQPYIVAYMTEALEAGPDDVVLEIGTGSGYQTAVLASLVREVISMEVVPGLAERARRTLEAAGVTNTEVVTGSGWEGWPARAPYARIIVTAAPPRVPQPLLDQLAIGGTMVIPVGTGDQEMHIITRTGSGISGRRTIPVAFVPMIGDKE